MCLFDELKAVLTNKDSVYWFLFTQSVFRQLSDAWKKRSTPLSPLALLLL